MRSYFVFARTPDQTLHRCNIAVGTFVGMEAEELLHNLEVAAMARFKQMGVRIPEQSVMRFLPDARNEMTMAEYEADMLDRATRPAPRRADGPDVVVYEHGKTPRH